MSYAKKLEELIDTALEALKAAIEEKGQESKHMSFKALPVTNEALMFNLDGGRFLEEVAIIHGDLTLIDDGGYTYNVWCLDNENGQHLMMVADHLLGLTPNVRV